MKPLTMANGLSPTPHIFILVKHFFIVPYYGANSKHLLNTAKSIEIELFGLK